MKYLQQEQGAIYLESEHMQLMAEEQSIKVLKKQNE